MHKKYFFKLEVYQVYYYAHSPLHIHDKIINDTLIMTLACHATPLQLPFVCIENFVMFCSKISPVFPMIGLVFPTQMYSSHSFIKPCTTSDADLFPEVSAPSLVPGTFSAAGFQLLVFPQESKLPRQKQNFLSHLIYPHHYLNSSL